MRAICYVAIENIGSYFIFLLKYIAQCHIPSGHLKNLLVNIAPAILNHKPHGPKYNLPTGEIM